MSQKSQALSVPGILMMLKVKDKVETGSEEVSETNPILISTGGNGLELRGGGSRRQTSCKEKEALQSALTPRTCPSMAPSFYWSSESPRMLPSL